MPISGDYYTFVNKLLLEILLLVPLLLYFAIAPTLTHHRIFNLSTISSMHVFHRFVSVGYRLTAVKLFLMHVGVVEAELALCCIFFIDFNLCHHSHVIVNVG